MKNLQVAYLLDFYENGVFKCPSLYTGGAGKGYELGVKLRGNYNAAPSIYSPQIICNYSFAEKKINEIQFPQYYVTWSITKENVNSSTGTLLNSVSSSIQTLNLPEEVKHFSCPDICLSYPENLSGTYSIVPYSSGLENSNNMQCIYSGKLLAPNPTPNPSAPHDTCDELSVDRIKACGCIPAGIADLTSKAYFILQIIGPVLLLILGGFDMAKAIATQDESAIEKAKKKLVNKFIAAAAIFFVFTIMQFLVNLLAKNATGIIECVDILLNGYVI